MAKRAKVGVTGSGARWSPSWWCTWLVVRLLGAQPVRISIYHHNHYKLDALIIGGGDDIAPDHYGGTITEKVIADPARDKLEICWIKTALDHEIPLLGICRGAQLINVVLGGNLHQDIRAMRKRTHNRPGLLPTKSVKLDKDSELGHICGRFHLRVNSLHHQAINQPGHGLRIVGTDRDQITQAIEANDGRTIIGVQWHPEYLFYLPNQWRLFRWLLHKV